MRYVQVLGPKGLPVRHEAETKHISGFTKEWLLLEIEHFESQGWAIDGEPYVEASANKPYKTFHANLILYPK